MEIWPITIRSASSGFNTISTLKKYFVFAVPRAENYCKIYCETWIFFNISCFILRWNRSMPFDFYQVNDWWKNVELQVCNYLSIHFKMFWLLCHFANFQCSYFFCTDRKVMHSIDDHSLLFFQHLLYWLINCNLGIWGQNPASNIVIMGSRATHRTRNSYRQVKLQSTALRNASAIGLTAQAVSLRPEASVSWPSLCLNYASFLAMRSTWRQA